MNINNNVPMVKSYGIALLRNQNNESQILLCRRRNTYEFCEFVRGKLGDENKTRGLFNKMTHDEKTIILSFNFDLVWFKFSSSLSHNATYKKHKRIFLGHNRHDIESLIKNSTNGELLWEIPKGRANRGESPLDTSIRELREELSISYDEYNIMFNINPKHNLVSEFGINYYGEYYVAEYKSNRKLYFGDHQISEVCGSKWWSIRELEFIENENIKKLAIDIIKCYEESKAEKNDL